MIVVVAEPSTIIAETFVLEDLTVRIMSLGVTFLITSNFESNKRADFEPFTLSYISLNFSFASPSNSFQQHQKEKKLKN